MNRFLHIAILLVATACGTTRSLQNSESSRVEVRTVTEYVKDTVYLELPVIIEKVATLDTASTLENKYAKSEASVSGGVLTHSLSTKPAKEPVIVENQIVYRDSLVYVDRIITQTKEVEKPLTWWQKFKMKAGLIAIIITLIGITYFIITHLSNLNLKSL